MVFPRPTLPLPPFRSVRPFHIPLSSLPPATKLSDELSLRILHEKVAASLMQQNGGASIVRTVAALMLPCNTVSASPIDFCGGLPDWLLLLWVGGGHTKLRWW